MSLPTFVTATPRPQAGRHIKPHLAAQMLDISRNNFGKLVAAGILDEPLDRDIIAALARRDHLAVATGELTVLRTAARATAYDEREWIGFHIDHTDHLLEETSLRWWRAVPDRVLDNRLYAITVATIPVAVYQINEVAATEDRENEKGLRYHFAGDLLARLRRDDLDPSITRVDVRTDDAELRVRASTIMASRISVNSGGPIGYLEPGHHSQPSRLDPLIDVTKV